MVDTASCNDGHRGEIENAWLQRGGGRADKSAKNGLQLERDVLVGSDFPSEVYGRGEMQRNVKGEGGMSGEKGGRRR